MPEFTRRVCEPRPRWVGFLGITAYRVALRRPKAKIGRQDTRVADAGLWVLPTPSGLNRSWRLPALTAEFGRLYHARPRRLTHVDGPCEVGPRARMVGERATVRAA